MKNTYKVTVTIKRQISVTAYDEEDAIEIAQQIPFSHVEWSDDRDWDVEQDYEEDDI